MSVTVDIVLAGVGGYGRNYLHALLGRDRPHPVRLMGVVDPYAEKSSCLPEIKQANIPVYACLDDFYARHDARLAVLSSPIQFHASQACLALARGSHVLCEKPLCATPQEAVRMIRAAQTAGRFLAVGYQWSFAEGIQALKADIRGGVFGRPRRLKTITLWPRDESYYRRNGWAGRIHDDSGCPVMDSPVNNATAHYLHNMFYVLGSTRETSAWPRTVQGETYRANDIENYDTAALRAMTGEGVEIMFFTSHATWNKLGPVFRFEFENAVVKLDDPLTGIEATLADGERKLYTLPRNDHTGKLWECVRAAADPAFPPPACDAAAAAAQTACMHALSSAARTFPETMRHVDGEPGRRLTWIEGLDGVLRYCYEKGRLPAEAGISWSCASETTPVAPPDQWGPAG